MRQTTRQMIAIAYSPQLIAIFAAAQALNRREPPPGLVASIFRPLVEQASGFAGLSGSQQTQRECARCEGVAGSRLLRFPKIGASRFGLAQKNSARPHGDPIANLFARVFDV